MNYLSFHFDEQLFWDSPCLLDRPDRQLFIYRDANSGWKQREKNFDGWADPADLPRKNGSLCAIMDMQGRAHLVIFEEGDLYHLTQKESRFSENRFHQEKNRSCSHVLLACDSENTLHLIYLALDDRNCRWWLLYHRCSPKGWEEPRVIDCGEGAGLNYGWIAVDHKNNLHLVYRIKEHKQTALYYRHFSPVAQNWSKALLLALSSEISYPTIAVDPDQNLHTLWVAADQSGYQLFYRVMVQGGWPTGGWKPATVLSPPSERKLFPFFNRQQENLIMAWLDQSAINCFRYNQHSWEKLPLVPAEEPVLTRHCVALPPGAPSLFWSPTQDGSPLPLDLRPANSSGKLTENLEPQFNRLEQVSEAMVRRASSLHITKNRLEQSLDDKRKELTLLSRQNRNNIQVLQQNLEEKDHKLSSLEEKFKHTIAELRQKMEQAENKWSEEKKLVHRELQGFKKDRRQFDLMLKEKENTIARLDQRLREQEQQIKQLAMEKEALAEKLSTKWWNFMKSLGKMIHNKP